MVSAGTRAYNWGLGTVSPAASRGRAPGQWIRRKALLKLKTFFKAVVKLGF